MALTFVTILISDFYHRVRVLDLVHLSGLLRRRMSKQMHARFIRYHSFHLSGKKLPHSVYLQKKMITRKRTILYKLGSLVIILFIFLVKS